MDINNLNWVNVESSQIDSLAYDKKNKTVFVKFVKGAIWKYLSVSEIEFNSFVSAPSVGKYFSAFIKNDKTSFRIL